MGWMHDTLAYFQSAPKYRTRDYHKLTFSMVYAYNEDYLLPLCHDEVVHGKATIVQKMNGVNSNPRIPFVTQDSLFVNENPVL